MRKVLIVGHASVGHTTLAHCIKHSIEVPAEQDRGIIFINPNKITTDLLKSKKSINRNKFTNK